MKFFSAPLSRQWRICLLALALVALSGCKGEGGGDGGAAAPSSNWDSLVWDQGNWS